MIKLFNSIKEIDIKKNKTLNSFLICLFFLAILFFSIKNSLYGFDITDEGLYLTLGLRAYLGDIFIKDELFNKITCFQYIYYPFFKLFPDIPLIYLRIFSTIFNSIPYIILFYYLKNKIPNFLLLLILSIPYLTNTFMGMHTPGYNSVSSTLILISIGLHLISYELNVKRNKIFISIFAGIIFVLGGVSYITLNSLLLIPIIYYIHQIISQKSKLDKLPTKWFLLTSISSYLILFILLFTTTTFNKISFSEVGSKNYPNIIFDLIKNFHFLIDYGNSGKIYIFLSIMVLISFLFFDKKKIFLYSVYIILSLVLFAVLFSDILRFNLVLIFLFSVFSIQLVFVLLKNKYILFKRDKNLYLIVLGAVFSIIYLLSTTHIYFERSYAAAYQGFGVIIIMSLLTLYYVIKESKNKAMQIFFYVFILILFINSLRFNQNNIYRDDKKFKLNSTFKDNRLKGIYSTKYRTEIIDSIIYYVKPKINRGDFLLSYPTIPMMNYITYTRPATNYAWMSSNQTNDFKKNMIKTMESYNRVPKICIVMFKNSFTNCNIGENIEYKDDFIIEFIESNYKKSKTIGPFNIYEKK